MIALTCGAPSQTFVGRYSCLFCTYLAHHELESIIIIIVIIIIIIFIVIFPALRPVLMLEERLLPCHLPTNVDSRLCSMRRQNLTPGNTTCPVKVPMTPT